MSTFDLTRLDALCLPVAEWLGTFALHSTVVLAVTWMLTKWLRGRALGLQDALLRQALWLPLVSSTVQLAVLGSLWTLGGSAPAVAGAALDVAPWIEPIGGVEALPSEPSAFAGLSSTPLPKALIVVAVAAVVALCGIAWLAQLWWRLRRVLATRRPEVDGRVLAAAARMAVELGLRQSPRVSTAAAIDAPIAFGMVRPEVCLPARAAKLDDVSLTAMLAHELAHLRRADAAWMWAAAWLQAVFPWQLLLLPVRHLWGRVVELRCDAEAAQRTSPTAVARCLIEVAEWLRPARHASIALGMAARPSALRERVEAVLEHAGPVRPRRALAFTAALLSLATMTVAAPGLRPRPGESILLLDEVDFEFDELEVESLDLTDEDDAPSGLRELMTIVERDYALLMHEADGLRADLAARSSPRSMQLQVTLQQRLDNLTRLRVRLMALAGRDVPGNR